MGMIALKCPGCGADIELSDSRDFGFCSFCGTKVIQDKLVVEHTGNVTIDNSEYVKRFLQNARRAKQKEDWEETEKYYNLVEQNDPTNIEAIFYSSYGKAKMSLVDSDIYKRQAVFNTLKNCVSILDDNYDVLDSEENEKIISQISDDIIGMAYSTYVYTEWKDGYGQVTRTNKSDTEILFAQLSSEFITTVKNIIAKDPKINYLKIGIAHCDYIRNNNSVSVDHRNRYRTEALELHREWNKLDPSHTIPEIKEVGCYVASAVYGSYDCPQVWTLRRFRDNTLAETWYGRLFIRFYYAVSPHFVARFGETAWFNRLFRKRLDRLVAHLNGEGVADAPYDD